MPAWHRRESHTGRTPASPDVLPLMGAPHLGGQGHGLLAVGVAQLGHPAIPQARGHGADNLVVHDMAEACARNSSLLSFPGSSISPTGLGPAVGDSPSCTVDHSAASSRLPAQSPSRPLHCARNTAIPASHSLPGRPGLARSLAGRRCLPRALPAWALPACAAPPLSRSQGPVIARCPADQGGSWLEHAKRRTIRSAWPACGRLLVPGRTSTWP